MARRLQGILEAGARPGEEADHRRAGMGGVDLTAADLRKASLIGVEVTSE